jgi:cytochrome bd-type quinol oxidase subunit 2
MTLFEANTHTQFALFMVVAFMISMFLIMNGTDFGAGITTIFARNDKERDEIVRTSGPVWGGNEAWYVAGFAAMFGAVPHWYASMASAFYIPLLLILIFFMFRGVSFDFRHKWRSKFYNRFWDWAIFAGSLVPPFLFGMIFAGMLRGLPIEAQAPYTINAGFTDVVNGFSIWSGLTVVLLCLNLGMARVTNIVGGDLKQRLSAIARIINLATIIGGGVEIVLFFTLTTGYHGHLDLAVLLVVILVAALLVSAWALKQGRHNANFWSSVVAMAGFSGLVFSSFYQTLIVGTTGFSLSIPVAASGRDSQLWVVLAESTMLPLMIILMIVAYTMIRNHYHEPARDIEY